MSDFDIQNGTGRSQAAGPERGALVSAKSATASDIAAAGRDGQPSLSRRGEIALGYAKKGFKVFPIAKGTKADHRLTSWTAASDDESTIRRWWLKWPNDNIGIACGLSGLCVIDLDVDQKKGKDGRGELDDLELIHGRLPNTLMAKTPNSGCHLYFRGTTGQRPIGKGIDVRSVGGYVVAPGSSLDKGEYAWCNDNPIANLPSWLERLIGSPRERKDRDDNPAIELDDEATIDRAKHYLAHDAQPAIEGLLGNNTTYAVAAHVRGLGVSEPETLDMMLAIYNDRCQPPWSDDDMRKLVGNAYRYAQNQLGSENAKAEFVEEAPIIGNVSDEPTSPAKRRRLRPLSFAELKELNAPRWLAGRLIPENGLAVVYGKPKVGKTFWALDLSLCIATGHDFHGVKVQKGRVTYVAAEGGPARLRDRVTAWLRERVIDERELDGQWELVPAPVNLTDPKQVTEFLHELGGPRSLVVFDTLARCMSGDENSQKDMGAAVVGCDRVRTETGAAVLLVHHEGKDVARGPRGSTALLGAIDASIRGKQDGSSIVFTVKDLRDDEAPPSATFELATVMLDGLEESSAVLRPVADRRTTSPDMSRIREIASEMHGEKVKDLVTAVAKTLGLKSMTARRRVTEAIPERAENAISYAGGLLWLERPGINRHGGLVVQFMPPDD